MHGKGYQAHDHMATIKGCDKLEGLTKTMCQSDLEIVRPNLAINLNETSRRTQFVKNYEVQETREQRLRLSNLLIKDNHLLLKARESRTW